MRENRKIMYVTQNEQKCVLALKPLLKEKFIQRENVCLTVNLMLSNTEERGIADKARCCSRGPSAQGRGAAGDTEKR